MMTRIQHIMFLRNDKQKIITDDNPYLCEHGILGSSIECFYAQMLLYPFEEQLNLPSLPVQLGNSQYLKPKVVGEETTINCICSKAFIHTICVIHILPCEKPLSSFQQEVQPHLL